MMMNRPRRNRQNAGIRSLVREHAVTTEDLIAPLFVIEGKSVREPIRSMPGHFRLSIDELIHEARELFSLGIKCVALFPVIDEKLKTPDARESFNPEGLNPRAIRSLKEALPELLVMADVALDPYSSEGHDGLVDPKTGAILNDPTLEVLGKLAVCEANAGADILGPSDMMDGRIGFIRNVLDQHHFETTLLMSYAAKYASGYYGPFRDALSSHPKKGDKKTYQMDPANGNEAIREALLDEAEGADILMVKPGLPYLDIIYRLKEKSILPIAAYQVSGEYAMVKAAAQNGWIDHDQVMMESLTCFKRAGADIILTYFAKEAAKILHKT